MNVWTYWSGQMPLWIDTCINSIQKCCKKSNFHFLTPDELPRDISKHLNPRWMGLPPGVGTDCLRAYLLSVHGGVWIDADTICIRDPIDLFLTHEDEQFLYSKWPTQPDRAIAGYVYSPRGHPCSKRWLDVVNSALCYADEIGWGDLGEKALTPIVNSRHTNKDTWEMSLETFLPINIDCNVKRYFVESGWRDFVTIDTIGFGLNYSWMQARRRDELNPVPDNGKLMIQRLINDNR